MLGVTSTDQKLQSARCWQPALLNRWWQDVASQWISLSTKGKRQNLLYTCVRDCTIYDYYEWQFTSVYPLSIGLAKRNLYQSHQQNQQSNHNCQRFTTFQYSTFALDFGIGFKPTMLICWLDLHNQTSSCNITNLSIAARFANPSIIMRVPSSKAITIEFRGRIFRLVVETGW